MLIQSYQKQWPMDFQGLKNIIADALDGLAFSIEHVGSTAVPDLDAKPIIDIDIVYEKSEHFNTIRQRLESIGYFHNGDQGIPQREVFKRAPSSEKHPVLDFITHHLYACPVDSTELQRHLRFRDVLRRDPAARQEYQDIKYQIAEAAQQDRKLYAEMKQIQAEGFIQSCLDRF